MPFDPVAQLETALADDFNTPRALSVLAELLRVGNALVDGREREIAGRRAKPPLRARLLRGWRDAFAVFARVLGVGERDADEAVRAIRERRCRRYGIDPEWVERQLAERDEARRARDFERADAIRDALRARGVEVRDTRRGVEWWVDAHRQ